MRRSYFKRRISRLDVTKKIEPAMAEPVAVLLERLSDNVKFAQGVSGLIPRKQGWHVAITGGSAHDADAIVLALPAYTAGRLLEAAGASHARALAETPYVPSITVSLAYRDSGGSRAAARLPAAAGRGSRADRARATSGNPGNPGRATLVANLSLESRVATLSRAACRAGGGCPQTTEPATAHCDRRRWADGVGGIYARLRERGPAAKCDRQRCGRDQRPCT